MYARKRLHSDKKCRNASAIHKQNEDFWTAKRERNMARDQAVSDEFERRGWTVLRIWECELKKKNLPELLAKLNSLFMI
jgi:DNA mismatch endonuclease (patch repair protein)